jgi:dynein heavy chain
MAQLSASHPALLLPLPAPALQTKLSNPHYKPEIAAQTTLVNFCVTEKGLEDQLLALVVAHERPDLQEQAGALVRQLAEYTITLKELEDSLLFRLANAQVGAGATC